MSELPIQEAENQFIKVVNDLSDFCMKNKNDRWKGGFSGIVLITLPDDLDSAFGNVSGIVSDNQVGNEEEVVGNALIQLMTGMILMGYDSGALHAAVEAAIGMSRNAELVDLSEGEQSN
jgi:hypothetical protein